MSSDPSHIEPILFYDGECGLCDRTVRWLLARDQRRRLRFAPLQGSTYAALAIAEKPVELGTVVLCDAAGLHIRSAAVICALRHIGGVWGALASLAAFIPRPLRDKVYRFVAQRRTSWFGGKESCRLSTLVVRAQLLP